MWSKKPSFYFAYLDPTVTAAVTPMVYIGKDIYPFNTFTLQCTASKPANVIPSLQVSWYHSDSRLDNSIQGIDIVEEEANNGVEKTSSLSVNSAQTQNSGSYICSVEVSIPESNEVTSEQTATITITGT